MPSTAPGLGLPMSESRLRPVLNARLAPISIVLAIVVAVHGATSEPAIGDVFDPFPPSWRGRGLALATARRLVENQDGTLRAERIRAGLQFVLTLPPAGSPAASTTSAAGGVS